MFEEAKYKMIEYIKTNFDVSDDKIDHKLEHTFYVINNSEYLAGKLNLNIEETEIAKLIALFHDFGRFYEARDYKSFREDLNNMDHASIGVKVLFDENLIREFITDSKYDVIMRKAIGNHSKYILDTTDMTEEEVLQSKLIRDADKLDSFRAKSECDIYTMSDVRKEDIENSIVSDNIYNDFMNEKTILSKDRKTALDIWVSYIAFVFGLYFKESIDVVKKNNYTNILIDRFDYKNEVAKKQMEDIRHKVNKYINEV